ncbi:hypothetical protein ABK040_014308 [Willaertia magna]
MSTSLSYPSFSQLDSISYWTIFEYLPISSYFNTLLVSKEWNEHLKIMKTFSENQQFILQLEIEFFFSSFIEEDYNEFIDAIKNYCNNYNAISFLLKRYNNKERKLIDIFRNCELKDCKEIVLSAIYKNNASTILSFTTKSLQKDIDILQKAYINSNNKNTIASQFIPEEYFLDYNFCNFFLQFKENIEQHTFALQNIKNKECIINYFQLNKGNINLNILLNLNEEIIKDFDFLQILFESELDDSQLKTFFLQKKEIKKEKSLTNLDISILLELTDCHVTQDRLNYHFEPNNLDLLKNFDIFTIQKFIVKKPFLITLLYHKLTNEEILKICRNGNEHLFKVLYEHDQTIIYNDKEMKRFANEIGLLLLDNVNKGEEDDFI